ncbi:MAG: glycosyltransferase [Saprospiraceae bacterium]|nr:glycosyltransferase [Saprospiraceae bacterium]
MSIARLLRYNLHIFLRPRNYVRAWRTLQRRGARGLIATFRDQLGELWQWRAVHGETPEIYRYWIQRYDTLDNQDFTAIASDIGRFHQQPLMAVIIVDKAGRHALIDATWRSLASQLYPHWEGWLLTDQSQLNDAMTDQRLQIRHGDDQVALWNEVIRESNAAFVLTVEAGDLLAPTALYFAARTLQSRGNADILYTDEDRIDERGRRIDHNFKPAWNRDWFYSQDDVSRACLIRRTLIVKAGGMREAYHEATRYDLLLRCLEYINGDQIVHIPHVLVHVSGSTQRVHQEEVRALQEHLLTVPGSPVVNTLRDDVRHIHWPVPQERPLVSIIIPTRNAYELLKVTIESIIEHTTYQPYEILIVDNQSDEPDTIEYLGQLSQEKRIRVLSYDHPFNYAAICNHAVDEAAGSVIALVNNDIQVIIERFHCNIQKISG